MAPIISNAWMVTDEYLVTKKEDHIHYRRQIVGPRGATPDELRRLKAGEGTPFRLHNEDGFLYYAGRFLGEPTSEEAQWPLDEFGVFEGCTTIQYYNPATLQWETL
jgi:hypothetical protein